MACLDKIEVVPLASESLGVRSMSTLVRTPDVTVLIDPGVSLGKRFALLPHPREYEARDECRRRVREAASEADVLTISHYHFDHYTPTFTDTVWNGSSREEAKLIYQGKTVLAKDTLSFVNLSQRRRGWIFKNTIEDYVKELKTADGKEFTFGNTLLKFSNPVFHGEEHTALGWVLMLTIKHDHEKVMYAPDIQGPIVDETLALILHEKPNLLIIGGPPIYLADFKISKKSIMDGINNLVQVAKNVATSILDHHLLRSEDWKRRIKKVFEATEEAEHKVLTAAEYLKEENNLLECRRPKLYEEQPPSQTFLKWARLPPERRRLEPPPI